MKLELEPIEADNIEQTNKNESNAQSQSVVNQTDTASNEAELLYQKGMMLIKDQTNPENARKSYDFFKKAAQMQHAPSQCNLGLLYEEGMGIEYDPEKAVYWYRKSAQQGFDVGMVNLAKMLIKGEGVKASSQEAKDWILKAHQKGNAEAQDLLAYVEDDNEEVSQGGWIIFVVLLSIIPCVMVTFPIVASIFSSLGMESIKVIPAAVMSMVPSFILWKVLNAIFLDE